MILKRARKIKLVFYFRGGSAIFAGKVMILLSSGMKISGTDADTKNEKGLARFARSAWTKTSFERFLLLLKFHSFLQKSQKSFFLCSNFADFCQKIKQAEIVRYATNKTLKYGHLGNFLH